MVGSGGSSSYHKGIRFNFNFFSDHYGRLPTIIIANLIDLQVHQTLNWGFAAVLATALLAITLACLGVFWLLMRRRVEFSGAGLGR